MHILYQEEDNGFLGLSYEPNIQKTVMHIEFKKWSLDECRRYKDIWKIIKKNLKEAGLTEIYSLCDNQKAVKFNKFWGFKDTGLIAYTKSNQFNYILKLEI